MNYPAQQLNESHYRLATLLVLDILVDDLMKKQPTKLTRREQIRWWLDFFKANIRNAEKFRKELSKIFTGMGNDMLGRMKSFESNLPLIGTQEFPLPILTKNEFDGWMFNNAKWNKRLREEGVDFMKEVVEENGARTMAQLQTIIGADDAELIGSFAVDNPLMTQFIAENSIKLADSVLNSAEERIRNALAVGIENGESITKLRNRVKDQFENMSNVKAVQIARTETTRAANEGAIEAYKQSGVVVRKEWVTALDERVCQFCRQLDGKVFPVDNPFAADGSTVTGDRGGKLAIDYSDVNGPPLHPSCRCTLVPVVDQALLGDIDIGVTDLEDPQFEFFNRLSNTRGISDTEATSMVNAFSKADNEIQQIVAKGPLPKKIVSDAERLSFYRSTSKEIHLAKDATVLSRSHEYAHFLDNTTAKNRRWRSQSGTLGKAVDKTSKKLLKEVKSNEVKLNKLKAKKIDELVKLTDEQLKNKFIIASRDNKLSPMIQVMFKDFAKDFDNLIQTTTRKNIAAILVDSELVVGNKTLNLVKSMEVKDMASADILSALTKGAEGYGHSVAYWETPGYMNTEIFADLMNLRIHNQVEFKIMKKKFPGIVNAFEETITDIRRSLK